MIEKSWVKGAILLALVLGLTITLWLKQSRLFYVIIIIAGVIAGRTVYLGQQLKSKTKLFPLAILLVVLIFILASPFSRLFSLLFFISGSVLAYYLHQKKLVGSFKIEEL